MSKPLLIPIFYTMCIFGLSSIPGNSPVDSIISYHISPSLQNIFHIPEFGILAWLWMWVFYKNKSSFLRATLYVLIICLACGFLNELYQLIIPGRYASLSDSILNFVGILLGIAVYSSFTRIPILTRKLNKHN